MVVVMVALSPLPGSLRRSSLPEGPCAHGGEPWLPGAATESAWGPRGRPGTRAGDRQPVLQAGLRPFCVSLWLNGHWMIFLFVYMYFRFLMKSLKNLLEPVTCVQNS